MSRSPRRRDASDGVVSAHLDVLKSIVPGVATMIGRHCEVVLHDFRRPDSSIVAIAGGLTGRHVGGSMSQIGLEVLAAGDDAEDRYDYVLRSPGGRVMRSTTIPLRDADGHVFGAFCINIDTTELRTLHGFVEDMIGTAQQSPNNVTFVDNVGDVIDEVIREEQTKLGYTVDRFDKAERLAILRALDGRGVFSVQRSVPQVAEYLGVSRVTVYAYLREVRDGQPADGKDSLQRKDADVG
jgi:predicted transcriptional regulator YheO